MLFNSCFFCRGHTMVSQLLPEAEILRRLNEFRSTLSKHSIDLALIVQSVDLYYFTGTAQNAFLVINPAKTDTLFVRKYLPRAQFESAFSDIQPIRRFRDVLDKVASLAPQRIGIESDVLPTQLYLQIRAVFPAAEIVDISPSIRRIRAQKSPWEIDQIRQSALMLDDVFRAIPDYLRVGMTEIELAASIESHLRNLGHQGYLPMRAFNGHIHYGNVLFGASGASRGSFDGPTNGEGLYPAIPGGAGRNRLAKEQPIFVDLVSGFNGYLADATRVYCVGQLPNYLKTAHQFCIDLQSNIIRMIRDLMPANLIYSAILNLTTTAGYQSSFMGIPGDQSSFIAHGFGLEIDELPVITSRSEFVIPHQTVLAIEPKLVFPGAGAVGIENSWLISDPEPQRLTCFSDEIIEI